MAVVYNGDGMAAVIVMSMTTVAVMIVGLRNIVRELAATGTAARQLSGTGEEHQAVETSHIDRFADEITDR